MLPLVIQCGEDILQSGSSRKVHHSYIEEINSIRKGTKNVLRSIRKQVDSMKRFLKGVHYCNRESYGYMKEDYIHCWSSNALMLK